ncbi:hypothetical protein S40293_03610 [Stachybotrys chartarum IBT 40293]|nr:hypothetical protein S40293_03610 [Stachybotrys chartarum IBT 40293]
MIRRKSRPYATLRDPTSAKLDEEHGCPEAITPSPIILAVTKEVVLKVSSAHKKYMIRQKGQPLDIPDLDDVTFYDVSHQEQMKLLEVEVDRLLQCVATLDGPVEFPGHGLFAESTDENGFDGLSKLADQLLINTHVCRLDNEIVLHHYQQGSTMTARYWNSNRILSDLLESEAMSSGTDNASRSPDFLSRYCGLVDYLTAVLCRVALQAHRDMRWHVNIIGSLANYALKLKVLAMAPHQFPARALERAKRIFMNKSVLDRLGSKGNSFYQGLEARNVQEGTNPWILAQQFADGVRQHIPAGNRGPGDQHDGHVQNQHGVSHRMHGGFTPWNTFSDDDETGYDGFYHPHHHFHYYDADKVKELEAFLTKKDTNEKAFFSIKAIYHTWTSSTLLQILQEMKSSILSDLPSDGFDICSLIYETGTVGSGLPILLHQDRGAELQGTGDVNHVKLTYPAFKILKDTALELPQRPATTDDKGNSSVTLRLQFQSRGGDEVAAVAPKIIRKMTSMSNAIKVMIPLLCTSPGIVEELHTALSRRGELFKTGDQDHFSPDVPEFTAVAAMSTNTFEARSNACLPQSDYKSLSQSVLAQHDRRSTLSLGSTAPTNMWHDLSDQQKHQKVQQSKQKQEKLTAKSESWVFEEETIRVSCARYVYTVIGIGFTLVLTGLMLGIFLGFTIEDSIALQDVDPFGFTTYCWVIAAFIVVIAKSVRVENWPWRDFLLRRVTCRSLSELHAVTGIDEQDLIAFLLTKEYENVLITRGPYNQLFMRKGEGLGFSIDCKPQIRTLLAAGLIFVKVSTKQGTALVCLDLGVGRQQGSYARKAIRHSGMMAQGEIMCRYPPKPEDDKDEININTRLRHWDFYSTRWEKILGVYAAYNKRVR